MISELLNNIENSPRYFKNTIFFDIFITQNWLHRISPTLDKILVNSHEILL
jgi:hypothetical protein